jgi:hypothetical protein
VTRSRGEKKICADIYAGLEPVPIDGHDYFTAMARLLAVSEYSFKLSAEFHSKISSDVLMVAEPSIL